MIRLRSDQQLVALFRDGNDEAFRVIHDRYRPRLLAYLRQMLPGRAADVEDALQDVFIRTYAGLRRSNREIALRPWLYRVAHNRCIDELRRPQPVPELIEDRDRVSQSDPVAETERRESLRRLVADIGRLPDQQRSALLMREMSGMTYAEVACALGISVPAVKSLLVRARIGLAQAVAARDAACTDIRSELAAAHEIGVRPSWMARRHLRDCAGCRACRTEMRTQGRRVAALAPTVGPGALLATLFGVGAGAGGGTASAASAGGATAGAASGLATVTVGHVATILAAAVVTAGGAVAVQQTVAAPPSHQASHTQRTAPAGSDKTDTGALGVPALIPPAARPERSHAAPARRAPQVGARSGAGRRRGRALPAAAPSDLTAGQSTSSDADSTTCTLPPPPTACTASETTTCSTGSGATTSTGTPATTPSGQGTPTGPSTAPSGPGATTTLDSSSASTGATASTESGSTSGSTASATCSSTAKATGTPATEAPGTEATGTAPTGTPQVGPTQQLSPT